MDDIDTSSQQTDEIIEIQVSANKVVFVLMQVCKTLFLPLVGTCISSVFHGGIDSRLFNIGQSISLR